jgi:hypothetical protein
MVPHFEPCPYHCICGSFKKIGFEESRLGYQTFYNTLLKGDDISAAIDAVDNVTPNLEFVGFTAKRMFEMVTDGYINSLTVEKIESEKKKMLSLIKKNFRSDPLLIEFVHQAYSIEAQKKLFIETYSRIFLA